MKKFNRLEKVVCSTKININTDINRVRIENKTIDSGFTDKITIIDI